MDAEILRQLAADEPPLRSSGVRWEMLRREDGGVLIAPSEPRPFLYRGQTRRYQPCLPTISRGIVQGVPTSLAELPRQQRLALVADFARAWWFCEILGSHPAMIWAKGKRVSVNAMALAQHYGLPTGYVDLTESLEVAAFFATCAYDRGRWQPVTTGRGILYRIMWMRFERPFDRIKPIGLLPFPRPAEQWGWTMEMLLGEDFEALPFLQKIEFEHRADVSQYFFNQFDGGASLFPPDPLAEIANAIISSPGIPAALVRAVAQDFATDPLGVPETPEEVSQEFGSVLKVRLLEQPPAIVTDVHRQRMETIWSSRKDDFFESVGFRLTRTRK